MLERRSSSGCALSAMALGAWLGVALTACGDDGATGAGGGSTTATSTTSDIVAAGTGGGMGCGPAPGLPSTEACKACTWQHCCDQSQACAADPTCDELATCLDACGTDIDCRAQSCFSIGGGALLPVVLELELCQLESCKTECNVEVPCEQLGPPEAPTCKACWQSQCCDEAQASYTPDTLRLQLCQLECLDWPCIRACEDTYAAAAAGIDARYECFSGTCQDACTQGPLCGLVSFGDPACSTCATSDAAAACCDLYAECSADLDCIDFFSCHNSCTNPDECMACATLWPVAAAGYKVAAENCLGTPCENACPGLGRTCGLAHRKVTGACADCITQSCCAQGDACGTDPACAALDMCILLCAGDAACRSDCEAEFPGALTLYGALDTCKATSCAADCP